MGSILLIPLILVTFLSADVTMKKAEEEPEYRPPVLPPIEKPIRPVRPVINTGIVYQDNVYQENYQNSCVHLQQVIEQQDALIAQLQNELEELRAKEQQKLQETLRKKYEQQMKTFEKSSSSVSTTNSITISSEPIE
jgi:TolA-binding protein